MASWLMDTAMFKFIAPPNSGRLRRWLDAKDASVYLSTASLIEVDASIAKVAASQPQRGAALRAWFDDLITAYADRIHGVDLQIARRAGSLFPRLQHAPARHRFHDAQLLATAQIHGHGLITRRTGVFGSWSGVPIEEV